MKKQEISRLSMTAKKEAEKLYKDYDILSEQYKRVVSLPEVQQSPNHKFDFIRMSSSSQPLPEIK